MSNQSAEDFDRTNTAHNAIRGLLLALARYNEASSERDRACGECDRSWGYFGARHEDSVRVAASDIKDELDAYVDERITKILKGQQ